MTKYMQLVFTLDNGRTMTLKVNNPKPNLTTNEINQVMQTIVSANIFFSNGASIVGKKSAQIVDRQTTAFEIA